MPKRLNIVETNIRLCFPSYTEAEQQNLVREAFISTGRAIMEIGISWWGSRKFIKNFHSLEGIEHLNAAVAKNKGIILLTSHFTTLEIAGAFYGTHTDNLEIVYKYSHNPLFEAFIQRKRLQNFSGLLQHKDIRGIIRSIKKGNIVSYSPDQDFGEKDSVFAPFMGVETCTLVSTQKLAKLTKAPVVPMYVERKKDLTGYILHFSPALKNFPSDNDVTDAATVNTAIEAQVLQSPDQYIWVHRRFKSRPNGEADVYAKKN